MTDKEEMARLLNLSLEELDELILQGIIHEEEGSYPITSNVQAYLNYLKTRRDDKETKESYWTERAKHEKAKRKLSELKLKKLRDCMHDAEDVKRVMTDMLEHYRQRVLEIPKAVAPKIIGITNPGEIANILDEEIRAVLTELSEYPPKE